MKCLLVLSFIGLALASPLSGNTEVKGGLCPVHYHVSIANGLWCLDDCEIDSHCDPDGRKCCETNCGKRCLEPVVSTEEQSEVEEKSKVEEQNEVEEQTEVEEREEIAQLLTTVLEERQNLTEKLDIAF